ncbi:siroheme synthase [Rhizobium sp. WL3]|uniref:siroheme synthase family protein n=1 Tax=Rhizobium sp. WL3 TaxID=2603277 RepID=UPI0011C2041C|nr:SAM-dependent methyltransferase [Rhizobium sp. WL3]QEE45879.1 siroheme synthase [Rhizobium sp. WL3]
MRKRSSPQSDEPGRIEPLAKLPVFWNLSEKRVVIAGGSDAAAWKAELLAACGALVDVYAEAEGIGAAMQDLVIAEKVTILNQPWHIGMFHGASMAIADCDSDDEARAFSCAALAAGVPFNVIDKPAYCQFQFGSIVNRSPVILSISTDGAAPILAQAIRRRVETLLPPSLKDWAMLAQTLRATVNSQLEPGPKRRAFWERFVDRCFSSTKVPGEDDRQGLISDVETLCSLPLLGSVTIVGAGPGDAELLTLKAVRCLQAADLILFDEGVSSDVLELARREAKRMLVGADDENAAGRDANLLQLVVGLARTGKRVVLLRAGDPAASATVTDMIEDLQMAGLQVDLVPGISERASRPFVANDLSSDAFKQPITSEALVHTG